MGSAMTITDRLFFIIDSEKLDKAPTGLYGFLLDDSLGLVERHDAPENMPAGLCGNGCYVYIRRDGGSITVEQDCNGSFGLFIYRRGGYFALSNSFLHLYEYLQGREKMTFDREYAEYLLFADLCSIAYTLTPVKEITRFDKDSRLTIDTASKTLKEERTDWREQTLSPDSPEGIAAIDKWLNRWASVIAGIKKTTDNISCDLSGGFDSRMAFMLLLLSGADLREINVRSSEDNLHTHAEDYEIARRIAGEYGFPLNDTSRLKFPTVKLDLKQSVYSSALLKFGFHRHMSWKTSFRAQRTFAISGYGGESLRSYWDYTPEEYLKRQINRTYKFSSAYAREFLSAVSGVQERNFSLLAEKYGVPPSDRSLPQKLYNNVRRSIHFGAGALESYISNTVPLSPLLDPLIQTLKLRTDECPDDNLLTALIYVRACPGLLEFPFEGGRSVKKETVACARRINSKYPPFRLEISDFSPNEGAAEDMKSAKGVSGGAVDAFIEKCFTSPRFKAAFTGIFGREIYDKILADAGRAEFYPLADMYAGIPVAYIADTCASKAKISLFDYMLERADDISYSDRPEPDLMSVLRRFNTARIDIKHRGEGCDIAFEDVSDGAGSITTPEWFSDGDGTGYVYTSFSGKAEMTLVCKGSGILDLEVRTPDIRDENGERLKEWIDYTKMTVNGETVFDEAKRLCHDVFYRYTRPVKDGERVTLSFEWEPDLLKNSLGADFNSKALHALRFLAGLKR